MEPRDDENKSPDGIRETVKVPLEDDEELNQRCLRAEADAFCPRYLQAFQVTG